MMKKTKTETFTFRNETFVVERCYFQCEDSGRTFTNAEVDDQALNEVYSQYRERHGIPSPALLKELRGRYGLSAHVMSRIAGIGVNQYGLYENGEMPTLVVGHKLASLFDKQTMLRSVDSSCRRLGKDYPKVRAKVESYVEPQVFDLRRDYYPEFDEVLPFAFQSLSYQCRKARWTAAQI